jgi:hypothetical protein
MAVARCAIWQKPRFVENQMRLGREELPKRFGVLASEWPLARRFLDFLAGLLYASANVIDGIVNSPSGALHRPAGTSAGDNGQQHDCQSENCFHTGRIKPLGK